MRKHIGLLIAIALLILPGAACRPSANLTPQQQTQINLYASLDTISQGNRSVAEAIVSLNKQGTVTDTVTRSVLDYSQKVNDATRAALAVLDSTQTPTAKAQAVLDLLKKLDLPPPVADFVNSNPAVAAVLDVVKTIVTIQQSIALVTSTPPSLLSVDKGGAK